MKPNEYRCAECDQVFEKAWTDEEARAEREKVFAGKSLEGFTLVCDDCYQKLMLCQRKRLDFGGLA